MKAVINYALQFIGEKEKPNNGGFYNPILQEIMTRAGHKMGEAWCCYFAEACFCEPIRGTEKEKELRKLFSASCVQTYNNFLKSGKYKIVQEPVAGALVLFQKYTNGVAKPQGHAALCVEALNSTDFTTIEGNTNSMGGREGDSVQPKKRTTRRGATGLNVMGFIIINE